MNEQSMAVGKSVPKQESWEKVSGTARYTGDGMEAGTLHVRMVTSRYGHADLISIDLSEARKVTGVHAVLTGEDCPVLAGEDLRDRPVIAIGKVRYFGEPVAVVVADSEVLAKRAADSIRVTYKPLAVVNSPSDAMRRDAPLVHEHLERYERTKGTEPLPGTNIANVSRIRKGDMERGWAESAVTVERRIAFGPSDHAAMETRCTTAEIKPDGRVLIETSSQAPFAVKKYLALYFGLEPGYITVRTPLVGGAFGGKASIQLELIAYAASRAVGGRKVKLQNTREEDMATSPVHIGLESFVKLGADADGRLKAVDITYWFDGGAYSDKAIDVVKAAVQDCTGPYSIANVRCDGLSVYTNHPYASAYRGYGHSELTFAMERAMDALAERLGMDPLELRRRNAIVPGDTSATQTPLTPSNVGDLPACLNRLAALIEWGGPRVRPIDEHTVRAIGISCFWKNSSIDVNAGSGAVLLFDHAGSVHVTCGVVEIGTGTKTVLTQLVAERLRMDVHNVHVKLEVDTDTTPEHWKTVASRGTLLGGRAVLAAADDAIAQLKAVAACVLHARTDDLEVADGYVFVIADPAVRVAVKEICFGYTFPNGNTIGGQVIGRGQYVQRQMTYLDQETGRGNPGPEWGLGAQAVEVELDTRECTYRLVRAVSVVDAGRVLNRKGAEGQVMGAMKMGLGFANRETFYFDRIGALLNPTLRDYNLTRYGEQPEYVVEFIETPCADAPYGARALGEHGLIGMPAALAAALSSAAGVELLTLPLFPETIWRARMEAGR